MQTELFHSKQFNEDKLTSDELFRHSRKYQGGEAFTRFFSFISRFNHYSRFNAMLIFLQNEHITFFGGSQFWRKKFNRTISKDARPYVILQPFGPVMVAYDVIETEGRETPEDFIKNGLGTDPFEIKGRISLKTLEDAILTAM